LIFLSHFAELPAKNQPLLDYCWDISRDWERLQRTTTQLCMGDCIRGSTYTSSKQSIAM